MPFSFMAGDNENMETFSLFFWVLAAVWDFNKVQMTTSAIYPIPVVVDVLG